MTQIDLTKYEKPLKKFLDDCVKKMVRKHPKDEVALMHVQYAGLDPYIQVSFDTQADNEERLEEGDALSDDAGEFSAREPFTLDAGTFAGWKGFPDMYEVEYPLTFKQIGGAKVVLKDSPNEPINEVMYTFLRRTLATWDGYKKLKRAEIFRIMIAVNDSAYGGVWRV